MIADDAHLITDSSSALGNAGIHLKPDMVNRKAKEYSRREDGVTITTNAVEGYFAMNAPLEIGVYHHVDVYIVISAGLISGRMPAK